MEKKFISNLILIILLNLLVKPFAIFGIDAGVQNRVSTEAYGLYFSLLNLSFIFNIITDLGINNFTTRNIAQYPKVMPKYFGKVLSFRLLLFVVYSLLTLTAGFVAGYRGEALYFLSVLIFNQLLATLIGYLRSHFGGLLLFRTDALISVLDRLLLILFCGSALLMTKGQAFHIEWFIWLQTAAYAVALIVAFYLLTRHVGLPKFSFSKPFSLAILRKSYPFALLFLLMMLYTRSDSVLLERLHPNGAFQSGIYAKGFRLLDAFYMFGMIFANLLLPLFARTLKDDRQKVLPVLKTAGKLLIGGSIFIAFLCHFNAKAILSAIYSSDITETILPFQLIMWAFVGMSTSLIFGTLLTANGELKLMNRFAGVGVIVNILLNVFLIPTYGAQGAAVACLITQTLMAIAQLILCAYRFRINLRDLHLHNYLTFAALLFGSSLLWLNSDYLLPLMLFVGTIGLFLLRLIDVPTLIRTFRENN